MWAVFSKDINPRLTYCSRQGSGKHALPLSRAQWEAAVGWLYGKRKPWCLRNYAGMETAAFLFRFVNSNLAGFLSGAK